MMAQAFEELTQDEAQACQKFAQLLPDEWLVEGLARSAGLIQGHRFRAQRNEILGKDEGRRYELEQMRALIEGRRILLAEFHRRRFNLKDEINQTLGELKGLVEQARSSNDGQQ
jgi:flagellar biosynthesis/type III secretory pathway protein FliH